MAGLHYAQTKYKQHPTPTGEAAEREAKEQLATVNGGGEEVGRHQLETDSETFTRQRGVERRP